MVSSVKNFFFSAQTIDYTSCIIWEEITRQATGSCQKWLCSGIHLRMRFIERSTGHSNRLLNGQNGLLVKRIDSKGTSCCCASKVTKMYLRWKYEHMALNCGTYWMYLKCHMLKHIMRHYWKNPFDPGLNTIKGLTWKKHSTLKLSNCHTCNESECVLVWELIQGASRLVTICTLLLCGDLRPWN